MQATDACSIVHLVIWDTDLLAEYLNALVLDYFHSSPTLLSWIEREGKPVEEMKHLYDKFVAQRASSSDNLPTVIASVGDAKLRWPAVSAWLGLGLDWGGKVISLPLFALLLKIASPHA